MTFNAWLRKNRWRADPIGDLARDVHNDSKWPRRGSKFETFATYLLKKRPCDGALRAVCNAWSEFELFTEGIELTHPKVEMLHLRRGLGL